MATSYLPADFVARYARPPSDTTVSRAISVHQSVRDLLGDSDREFGQRRGRDSKQVIHPFPGMFDRSC